MNVNALKFQIYADDDVLAVTAFMQETLTADRLVSVAEAIAGLAPALWGHFDRSEVRALSLKSYPLDEAQTISRHTIGP